MKKKQTSICLASGPWRSHADAFPMRELQTSQFRQNAKCSFDKLAQNARNPLGNRIEVPRCYNVDAFPIMQLQTPTPLAQLRKQRKLQLVRNCEMARTLARQGVGIQQCCHVYPFPTRQIRHPQIRNIKHAKCDCCFWWTKLRNCANPCRQTNRSIMLLQCWCISWNDIGFPISSQQKQSCIFYEIAKWCKPL